MRNQAGHDAGRYTLSRAIKTRLFILRRRDYPGTQVMPRPPLGHRQVLASRSNRRNRRFWRSDELTRRLRRSPPVTNVHRATRALHTETRDSRGCAAMNDGIHRRNLSSRTAGVVAPSRSSIAPHVRKCPWQRPLSARHRVALVPTEESARCRTMPIHPSSR
jgi:hypothetical protein